MHLVRIQEGGKKKIQERSIFQRDSDAHLSRLVERFSAGRVTWNPKHRVVFLKETYTAGQPPGREMGQRKGLEYRSFVIPVGSFSPRFGLWKGKGKRGRNAKLRPQNRMICEG